MRHRALLIPVLLLVLSLVGCEAPSTSDGPTQILTGPRFYTGDAERPWADGLLVVDGRIERVLSREEIPELLASGGTVREIPGALALPGLVDAHAHILGYGQTLQRVDLVGLPNLDETLTRIADFAAEHPEQAWVQGRGWDQNDWPGTQWPSAADLDRVVSERPVALRRIDGHAMWVNSRTLELAGITAATPDPPGGAIHRDGAGEPTGILIDTAMRLVGAKIPRASDEELRQALEAAAQALLRVGLTGVHDMGVDERAWNAMCELARERRFPLSVYAYASRGSSLHRRLLEEGPIHEGRLHLVGVKLFADGALGSRGARLLEPYSDEQGTLGLWLTEPSVLTAEVERLRQVGVQPAIHAIGDAANRAVLDAFAATGSTGDGLPPRVEHAQIVAPQDLERFAALGAVASMQPTHATSDMDWADERVGDARLAGAYAWRTLLDSGALLAFGSDFPVESIDPRLGLYAAVARQDLNGHPQGGWTPEQRLTLAEALAGFTSGAARAVASDDEGILRPGAHCDLTVFDRDLFEVPAMEIPEARITATVVSGVLYAGE